MPPAPSWRPSAPRPHPGLILRGRGLCWEDQAEGALLRLTGSWILLSRGGEGAGMSKGMKETEGRGLKVGGVHPSAVSRPRFRPKAT